MWARVFLIGVSRADQRIVAPPLTLCDLHRDESTFVLVSAAGALGAVVYNVQHERLANHRHSCIYARARA